MAAVPEPHSTIRDPEAAIIVQTVPRGNWQVFPRSNDYHIRRLLRSSSPGV